MILFKVVKLNYMITITTLTIIIVLMGAAIFTSVRASEPEGIRVPIIMYYKNDFISCNHIDTNGFI